MEFRTTSGVLHPTEVDCTWEAFVFHGTRVLQLSSYGSDTRQSEPKVSQTLQFGEDAARDLLVAIEVAFPDLGAGV